LDLQGWGSDWVSLLTFGVSWHFHLFAWGGGGAEGGLSVARVPGVPGFRAGQ
jgi:hypothetical protein